MKMFCVLLFSILSVANGFLLDTNTSPIPGSGENNQFLTISEFFAEKKEQQYVTEGLRHDTDKLRHDMDKTFELISSQLQQRLEAWEHKFTENSKVNYTTLNTDVLQQKYEDLDHKYATLQSKFDALMVKYVSQEIMLEFMRNETARCTAEISELQQLKNIQPIQDVHLLQEQVKAISSVTQTLSINEQARSEDFLALYNKTLISERKITDLSIKLDNQHDQVQKIQNIQNKTAIDFIALETKHNFSIALLNDEIETRSTKVAVTSCVSTGVIISSDTVMIFDDFVTQIGFVGISVFSTTGKFTCEKSGLYLISVHIMSCTSGAAYHIQKNGDRLSRVYIGDHPSNNWCYTGTGTVTVQLQSGDQVSVQSYSSFYVYSSRYSCMSVVKIK